jgi:hypothetical protein
MFVPTMSAGMRSGVNWTARKLQVQDVGERMHEARLAHAGNALEQHVAARQQRRDCALDDLFVADDPLSNFLGDPREAFTELIDVMRDGNSHRLRMK